MHQDHPLQGFQRGLLRNILVERRNDPGICRAGVDMAGGKEGQRVIAVPAQQHIVELSLDLAVGHTTLPGKLLHKGVAGAVQRKMAHKAQRVGQRSLAVGFLVHHPPGPVKERSARLVVHGVAQRGDRGGLFRMVIEQQVRPVQTDIVQLPMCLQLFPQRRGQMVQHICAKTAVCVGRGHLSFLLLAVPAPAALFRLH